MQKKKGYIIVGLLVTPSLVTVWVSGLLFSEWKTIRVVWWRPSVCVIKSKIEPCCNLEPHLLASRVLISEARYTRVHTHGWRCPTLRVLARLRAALSALPLSQNDRSKVVNLDRSDSSPADTRLARARTHTHTHAWSLTSFLIGFRVVTMKWSNIRQEWAGGKKRIRAFSPLAGRDVYWLPDGPFTRLLNWHKMAARRWWTADLPWGQASFGCNKGDAVQLWDEDLYHKRVCVIFTTAAAPRRPQPSSGGLIINVFHRGHSLKAPELLHNCSLFMIYVIAGTLTSASLGIWFSLICTIKNSSMHYVNSVWCVNDV